MCPPHLAGIQTSLRGHLDSGSFLFKENIVTGSTIDSTGITEEDRACLLVLMDSLALAMDIEIPPRPSDVLCDILLAICGQPVIVLTLVDGDKDSETVTVYNTSVSRGVSSTLCKFMDDGISAVFGVLRQKDIEKLSTFRATIEAFVTKSAMFLPLSTLSTTPSKYENIVTAFWAGVAETKSVLSKDGQADTDFLRFLTKDQCIVLMENINEREVEVQFKPGTGATTLMVEIARRLAKVNNKTLLLCRSQEKERIRALFPNTKTVADLRTCDLLKLTNVVNGTGIPLTQTGGRIWTFTKDPPVVDELQKDVDAFENLVDTTRKLIDLLSDGDKREKMKYLSGQFETLKFLDITIRWLILSGSLSNSVAFEFRPVYRYSPGGDKNQRLETRDYVRHVVEQLKHGLEKGRDLFPLLGDVIRQVMFPVPCLKVESESQWDVTDSEKITRGPKPLIAENQKDEILKRIDAKENWIEIVDDLSRGGAGTRITDATAAGITVDQSKPTDGHLDQVVEVGQEHKTTHETTPRLEMADTSHVKDAKTTGELKGRLKELEKEAFRQQAEIRDLTDATDHLVDWEYNMECLSQQMATIGIQDVITDIIGEDEIPVSGEQPRSASFDGDRLTRRRPKRPCLIYQLRAMEYGAQKQKDLLNVVSGDIIGEDKIPVSGEQPRSASFDGDRLTRRRPKRPCLIYQLRAMEYGAQKQKDLLNVVSGVITDEQRRLSYLLIHLDRLDRGPPMTFNRERAGFEDLTVSGDGLELVNWRGRSPDQRTEPLKHYWGTSSYLPIPLPPSPFTLTAATYWETDTRLQVKKDVSWWSLLEMAVYEEGEVDTGDLVSRQDPSSWIIRVGPCGKHPGVCTQVLENGSQVGECLTDTMSLTPGTDVTLKYGVTMDVGRGRLAFIDVNRGMVLHKFDVNFRESLSPIFCVWPLPDEVNATMRLISGQEVAMTGEKQKLIAQALFCK